MLQSDCLNKILPKLSCNETNAVIVCGATATGKSLFATNLARKIGGVVINADAMQVYKHIPLITSSPSLRDKKEVEHALYNFYDIEDNYSAKKFVSDATQAIVTAHMSNKPVVIVGGTGMYINGLLYGIDDIVDITQKTKEKLVHITDYYARQNRTIHDILTYYDAPYAAQVSPNDARRITRGLEVLFETGQSITSFHNTTKNPVLQHDKTAIVYVSMDRAKLYEKCNKRFVNILNSGGLDEVRELKKYLDSKKDLRLGFQSSSALKAVGLPEMLMYIRNQMSYDIAVELAQRNTRRLAKRQITWFTHQLINKHPCNLYTVEGA